MLPSLLIVNRLRSPITPLLLVYVLIWTVCHSLGSANLDRYGDMLENFAWGQVYTGSTFKHPPLLGWVTATWFYWLPVSDAAYYLLAFANTALGLFGIYRLAIAVGLQRQAVAVVALQMFALPYTTLAANFNANSILLAIWPWVVLRWWRCVHDPVQRLVWPIGLGVLASLAMLGKYYSGVLLLSLALASFAHTRSRDWLQSVRPWIALAVFILALTPHVVWLFGHDFATLRFVGKQGGEGVAWIQLLKFALAPLLYWGIALAVCVAYFGSRQLPWWRRVVLAWRPQGWSDLLFWVSLLPFWVSLAFGVSGFVSLSLPWSIPLGFAFPLLWLRNLEAGHELDRTIDTLTINSTQVVHSSARLYRLVARLLCLVVLGFAVRAVLLAQRGDPATYLPRREAAQHLLTQWQQTFPTQKLAWVGGTWAENTSLAFYGDNSIRALPGFPDQFPNNLDPEADWMQQPGVIYCPAVVGSDVVQVQCDKQALLWLAEHAIPVHRIEFRVQREGWRFPLERPFRYVAFFYVPPN